MPCNGPSVLVPSSPGYGCIRLRADAKAVQYDQKYALFHTFHSIFLGAAPEQSAPATLIISKSRRLCKRFVVESFCSPDEILGSFFAKIFLAIVSKSL